MSNLIKDYEDLNAEQERLEALLSEVKAKKAAKVKDISDTLGKGPHIVNGQPMIPINKAGSWFLKAPMRRKAAGTSGAAAAE